MIKDIINQLGENREDYFNAAIPPIFSNSNFLFSNVEDMRAAMIKKIIYRFIQEVIIQQQEY